MSQFTNCGQPDISTIAVGVLNAFRREQGEGRREALALAERFVHQSKCLDAGEAERIDALEGALEALEGPSREQVQAGMFLLEHLAKKATPALASYQTA